MVKGGCLFLWRFCSHETRAEARSREGLQGCKHFQDSKSEWEGTASWDAEWGEADKLMAELMKRDAGLSFETRGFPSRHGAFLRDALPGRQGFQEVGNPAGGQSQRLFDNKGDIWERKGGGLP